jgi:D-glycero-alpha-D-manno-heptose 1-phosphate guanylyltransferase
MASKITECIVLAGGKGTRLREAVPDYPKCIAPIQGEKGFLSYLIEEWAAKGVTHFIFSLGFQSDRIIDYIEKHHGSITKTFIIEDSPLDTGGAISYALSAATMDHVLVLNGDTMIKFDLEAAGSFHQKTNATVTILLKRMYDFERYGSVEIDIESKQILQFNEKRKCQEGYINTGAYIINKEKMQLIELPKKYSIERDFLSPYAGLQMIYGYVTNGYFIDMGIPEDYNRAVIELKIEDE